MIIEKSNLDFLIIVPPADTVKTIFPPYGAMYIASALRTKGYRVAILNVDLERISNAEVIERIHRLDPKYLGFSGIVAPSYSYLKKLSRDLRRAFPKKIQILGGGLTSAAEVLFNNAEIDVVVRGEGDITICELFECLEKKDDLETVAGIGYRCGPSFKFTAKRKLIANLDELPYPAYDLIDMKHYLPDGLEFMKKFLRRPITDSRVLDSRRKRGMMTLPTSRGGFAQCSFCFRAYLGLRMFSLKDIFDLVEYCLNNFEVGFFSFGDECFAPNKARNWEFIKEFKKRKLDIPFRIIGMRVDTVDRDILKAYKEIGCWMIEYGFESGSQKILNLMDKRVTVEQNRQVGRWTQEAGIYTSPTLVLGMPGENNATIQESIEFLKSLGFNFKQYQYTYALPIPGSPLYDYARLTGAIKDEDEYLSSLTGEVSGAGVFHVNLTDEPDEVVAGWGKRIEAEIDRNYYLRKYKIPPLVRLMIFWGKIKYHLDRKSLWYVIKKKLLQKLRPKDKLQPSAPVLAKGVRFRKLPGMDIEKLCQDHDASRLNREMALKKINEKMSHAGT